MTKMLIDRSKVEQALEALAVATNCLDGYYIPRGKTTLPEIEDAIAALEAALAKPMQEPVIRYDGLYEYAHQHALDYNDLCRVVRAAITAPPQRKPLTEVEIQAAWDSVDMRHPRGNETRIAFARAIERAHRIGGSNE